MSKIAVIVLGNSRSGKSTTWNELFGREVKTGSEIRELELASGVTLPVFLVSGSPEERGLYVGDIIDNANPRVILCSLQYIESARESIQFFIDNRFELYVQWINPGYKQDQHPDWLGFMPYLLFNGATVCIRAGSKDSLSGRVRDISNFLAGWASSRRI